MKNAMRKARFVIAALAVMVGATGSASANILVNGDFETGDLTGWTTFTTPQGDANISVQTFDVNFGTPTLSAAISGTGTLQPPYGEDNFQGGGIYQTVWLLGGDYSLILDSAAITPFDDESGTVISLLFDGNTVSSYSYGSISANATYRLTIGASMMGVSAGLHEVRILVTRNFSPSSVTNYIDNITLVGGAVAVPEPSSLVGLGIGGLAVIGYGRRRRVAGKTA